VSEPFLGEVRLFGFNFAPIGWASCDGQLMSIAQNTALFSLLGTFYGGNGTSTFALPDLRGRHAIHQGQGNGLSPYTIGEVLGTESVTLNGNEIPPHSHTVQAGTTATTKNPTNSYPGFTGGGSSYTDTPTGSMNPAMIAPAGGGQPFSIINPILVMNYCIALQGIFPSRN
jgi:microcystin-dependent protein